MPIMMVDRDLSIVYVNEATKRLVRGMSPPSAPWRPISIRSACLASASTSFIAIRPISVNCWLTRRAFRIAPISPSAIFAFALNVNPVFDATRKYIGNVLEWNDVSKQRVNEGMIDALGRSQAVIEFALDGRILGANKNFLDTLGYTIDEIRGQHHSMFVDPAYRQSAEYRGFWEKLARGEFIADKFKRIAKGGREVWIQASYNPILDRSGKPYKVVKFATDITEAENQATTALFKSAGFEGSSVAMMMIDRDFKVTYANDATKKLLKENVVAFRAVWPTSIRTRSSGPA